MKRLLLVEDDKKLAEMLSLYLGERDLTVTCAKTIAEANAKVAENSFDIVVLDLTLPDGDGIDFCRDFRKISTAPVLMLTARGDEMDKVVGLELGADDYLTKPFNPRELVARLRAILRRTDPAHNNRTKKIEFGDVIVDFDRLEATKTGNAISLTAHQFGLLKILVERADRVQSRDQLMDAMKGEEIEAFDRSIDVHISRIRAAIEDNPKKPQFIRTIRGSGYLFTPDPQNSNGEG